VDQVGFTVNGNKGETAPRGGDGPGSEGENTKPYLRGAKTQARGHESAKMGGGTRGVMWKYGCRE